MREAVSFKIGVSASYWNKVPRYLISICDAAGACIATTDELEATETTTYTTIEFDKEPGNYELRIELLNKSPKDTVVSMGNIVNDMLLNVDSIEYDGIELEHLVSTASIYRLKSPQVYNNQTITELAKCVNLGWNGYYSLPFTSPVHEWLLENL